jgi:hypothetical protein
VQEDSAPLWTQLALQSPALLACGAALVLATYLLRRQTRRAVLVFLAAVLLILAEAVPTVFYYCVLVPDGVLVDEVDRYIALSNGLTFAASVARGLALALLLAAAFLPGRGQRPDRGEDTAPRPDV